PEWLRPGLRMVVIRKPGRARRSAGGQCVTARPAAASTADSPRPIPARIPFGHARQTAAASPPAAQKTRGGSPLSRARTNSSDKQMDRTGWDRIAREYAAHPAPDVLGIPFP